MPYTSPATVVTGTPIASTWGNAVKAATDYLANPPACRVYHNTTQSATSGAALYLAFNSERFDTDTMHDTVTNNSRITFKTAGVYVVNGVVELAGDTDYTDLQVFIEMNGTTTIGFHRDLNPGTNTNVRLWTITTIYKFAVNDYVRLGIVQTNTSGGANNVNATGNRSPEFSAVWVGLG